MGARITQRQLAAAAGVSVATVSLVYSGSSRIPPATRERVRAMGEKLGYRPTPGLSAAMSDASRRKSYSRLAIIQTDDKAQRFYTHAIQHGANSTLLRAASDLGYGVEVIEIAGMTPQALRRKLEFFRVDGILVPMVPRLEPKVIDTLSSWPCLGLISQVRDPGLPIIENDKLMKSFDAFEEIARRGYRRTGIVSLRINPSRGAVSELGGLLAAREAHADCARVPVCHLDRSAFQPENLEASLRRVRQYINEHTLDSLVAGDLRFLEKLHSSIDDLDALGIACLALGHANTPISGMQHQTRVFHARALTLLDQMVRWNVTGKQLADLREVVKSRWHEGETLPGTISPDSAPGAAEPFSPVSSAV